MSGEDQWGPWIGDLLDCNPVNGSIIWKYRPRNKCLNENEYSRWNSRYAHTPAFACKNARGYLTGQLFGRAVLAHHIIWAFVHGYFPDGEIDHINGDTSDNSISNLRIVTRSENCRNAARRKDNSSGVTGVSRSGRKWLARIGSGNGRVTLGSFDNFDEAVSARKSAEKHMNYTARHGS